MLCKYLPSVFRIVLQHETDEIVGRQIQFIFGQGPAHHFFGVQPGHDLVHESFQYFVPSENFFFKK